MSRPRSVVADYLVYLVVRLFVCVVQALSPAAARKLAHGLAWLAHRLDRRHREVALDNLRHAFPDGHTDAERDALVRAVYRHFCTMLVEIIHLPRKLHPTNWRRHLGLPDAGVVLDRLLADRPVLVVTGHLGNWELAGFGLGLLGFRTHAIARPLDNPFLERFLLRFREK